MWSPLGIKYFVFSKERGENSIDIYISDFIRIWCNRLQNEEILEIARVMNPLMEAAPHKFIDKVLSLFDNITVVGKRLEEDNSGLILHLDSDVGGIRFHFKVNLNLDSTDLFFQKITLPLILLSTRLQSRENKLIEIIQNKDAEIKEYKSENISIKRSHLITKEFTVDELRGENEEALQMILNNPGLIYNLVESELLVVPVQPMEKNVREEKNVECKLNEIANCRTTSVIKKKHKINNRTDLNSKKVKNGIDVQINLGAKRNLRSSNTNLKL